MRIPFSTFDRKVSKELGKRSVIELLLRLGMNLISINLKQVL